MCMSISYMLMVGMCFKCTKSRGGGTHLKENLAHGGKSVKKCPPVPTGGKTYFQHDIDTTNDKKRDRFRQQVRTNEAA
jgi:hypothetical protein